MTPSVLSDNSAALRSLPLLGSIILYGVTELTLSHHEFVLLLKDENLDRWAPKAPADVDVFRRVCSAAQRKRIETSDPDVFVNVLVRDLANDKEEVVKAVVSERRDPRGRVLSHTVTHHLVFRKDSGTVYVRPQVAFPMDDYPEASITAGGIVPTYEGQRGTVNGSQVRDTFARILGAKHSISMKSTGGAFFTPAYELAAVEALERVATNIHEVDFDAYPMLDTEKYRRKVATSFENDVAGELDRITAELAEKLRDPDAQISEELYESYAIRYQETVAKAQTYDELLERASDKTNARLDMLDRAMKEIRKRGTPKARAGRTRSGTAPAAGGVRSTAEDTPATAELNALYAVNPLVGLQEVPAA